MMAAPVSTPDERTLREFLLGKLSPKHAEPAAAWLSGDPSAADACRQLEAVDPLTDALAGASAIETVPAAGVESVIRSVLLELENGNTPLWNAAQPTATEPRTPASAVGSSFPYSSPPLPEK